MTTKKNEKSSESLYETVIKQGYCVGCGVCAAVEGSEFEMTFQEMGYYLPTKLQDVGHDIKKGSVDYVCPFSERSMDEDQIGKKLFGGEKGVHYDAYQGYHLKSFAGYIKKDQFREKGSSGGFGSYIVTSLLEEGLVDKVIHVKECSGEKNGPLFTYQVSSTVEEVKGGAKSKYYPIEMSKVIKFIRENEGRYVIVGVPCFIKAIRLLAMKDQVIKERIKYAIGLVCGHLKSDRFAKAMAWEMGIKPDELRKIDFRKKMESGSASNYGVEVTGTVMGEHVTKTERVRSLYTSNWGYGFFKLSACEYCDDVLAETADLTIGDAWIPEYVEDHRGTNIIIVRNNDLLAMIDRRRDEIKIDEITGDMVKESQAGGFRHRREGLSYRLYLKEGQNLWHPTKRVKSSDNLTEKRKKIYVGRDELISVSEKAFEKALEQDDFSVFIKTVEPYRRRYDTLVRGPKIKRAFMKIKRLIIK